MTTGADLLGCVRGRRLCLEVARRGPESAAVHRAMFDAARQVNEERGDRGIVSFLFSAGPADAERIEPVPSPTLVEALTTAAAASVGHLDHLLPALSDTVTSAMYWQPPDAEDVVITDPAITARLLPIAEAVLAAPEARWWSTPLDRDAQVRTVFEQAVSTPPQGTATERLARWRDAVLDQERQFARDRAAHPDSRIGGTWWVTPVPAGLDMTTRALAGAGSAALWLTEDEMGWPSAELVPCVVEPAARVLEITGPEDWAALVAAYPLDVTASRRPDWFESVDAREGTWLIPDWSAVAEVYDGVHVTVLGWLTTSGVAVPVPGGGTTTLAGWDPDATWWLADVLREQGARQVWVRDDQTWRQADQTP